MITLWGWDIYILAFVGIGGATLLLGVFWLFFTSWPIPKYCIVGPRTGGRICG